MLIKPSGQHPPLGFAARILGDSIHSSNIFQVWRRQKSQVHPLTDSALCVLSLTEHFHQKVFHIEKSPTVFPIPYTVVLVREQQDYTATHSPCSSVSWEVKMTCTI